GGEPARRERLSRLEPRRQFRTGRLHAATSRERAGDEPGAVSQDEHRLRSAQAVRCDCLRRELSHGARRREQRESEQRAGARRVLEGRAAEAELGLRRWWPW